MLQSCKNPSKSYIETQYDRYIQLYNSCNSEIASLPAQVRRAAASFPNEPVPQPEKVQPSAPEGTAKVQPSGPEGTAKVQPSAPVLQPATEPQTQQLTQDGKCKALADKTKEEDLKLKNLNKLAQQGDKNAQKALKKIEDEKAMWSSFFPGYCSDKGDFVDYFSLLDVEKPNIESMSDEDFKGFVQKVNDAYLKHNNNDITRDIKGQKIRKAIANREKEKQELIENNPEMKKIKARYLKKEESLRKILGDGKSLKI